MSSNQPSQPSNGRPDTEQQPEQPTRENDQPGASNASAPAPSLPAHQGPPQGQRPASRPRPPQGPNQGAPQGPNQGPPQRHAPTQQRPPMQQNPSTSGGGPPWQRGPQQPSGDAVRPDQAPPTQQQPQTNLQQRTTSIPGQAPYAAAGGADDRTRDRSREEAKTKAAVIDGPTRNIARNDLPTDMPDLSSVRHPSPEPQAARPAAAVAVAPDAAGDPLRATVQIRKLDPWSMLKLSLVISVSLFFVWMVAVGLLYAVLDGMGVWDRLNNAFTDIVANSGDSGLVSAGQIFGYAAVIGLINVVLFTALTTIGSFIYNLSSDLVGGLEVTLADRD
ncbi:hypothetical protein GCM10007304_01470 [Rhodococcoides trifolii]|uniref:DUF3566 domain-containing protein n=1 Tax=Rhodococcoides trifolii TaxID=908250 RepID=A0A917CNG3_9NOCA|nr:DUF3566 domain-containing protein [Rhodococcus trifolii]GGF91245.1 hypothetical protein GCM10007304_01470 [Rhodococcus trifolii]